MPDSAPDQKVEDVLSSVRRLVSQEIPSRIAPKSSDETGALVLSSKDRIEADHAARAAERSLEQRIADLEAAVDQGSEEFEPDGSEDQSLHRPDRIVYTRPRPSEEGARHTSSTLRLSEIALIETGPANETDSVSDTPLEFRHTGAEQSSNGAEAPMAEDVPTLPAASAEVTAFSDPDDVVARIEARIERGGEADTVEEWTESSTSEDSSFDAELTAAVRASVAAVGSDEDETTDLADSDTLRDVLLKTVATPDADPSDTPPSSETASYQSIEASEAAKSAEASEAVPESAPMSGPSSGQIATSPLVLDFTEDASADGSEKAATQDEPALADGDRDTGTSNVSTDHSGDAPDAAPQDVETVADAASEQAASETDALDGAETEAVDDPKTAETAVQEDQGDAPTETPAVEAAAAALGALPDEEAMRLLVARLLREELQGELGERITRNVRKLVRREVLQMLDARALD